MARGGVTFTEVNVAAQYLQGLGKNPTVDAIREHLGTGSRTTLFNEAGKIKFSQGWLILLSKTCAIFTRFYAAVNRDES